MNAAYIAKPYIILQSGYHTYLKLHTLILQNKIHTYNFSIEKQTYIYIHLETLWLFVYIHSFSWNKIAFPAKWIGSPVSVALRKRFHIKWKSWDFFKILFFDLRILFNLSISNKKCYLKSKPFARFFSVIFHHNSYFKTMCWNIYIYICVCVCVCEEKIMN